VVSAPAGAAYANAALGAQVTGGSTSVREAWEKLRKAGAQARTMLVQAAATHWGVDAGKLTVDGGAVVNGSERLTYGELAETAAKLPVPKDVKLKPSKDFKVVGKPQKRLDTASKVDGTAEFGLDVKLPGMLYAALAQTPTLGGKAAVRPRGPTGAGSNEPGPCATPAASIQKCTYQGGV
jgi:isoquinoline 1-oxidoreductase beta subunit